MRHRRRVGVVVLCVLLASCPCASALNPDLDINQYAHAAWSTRDGFFKGTVTSIAQTPDGYLWLGTECGLFRFGGMRIVPCRADLYCRLNVFPIEVPPLRERPEDIPVLVRHFARDAARRMNRRVTSIASTAIDALVAHSWPGNIRELQNFVERAVIRSAGDELRVPVSELDRRVGVSDRPIAGATLEQVERAHILATLEETGWVLADRAARPCGSG